MTTVLASPMFDIELTQSRDYLQRNRYVLRYGLQVEKFDTLAAAIPEFNNCLHHARECEQVD